MGRDERKAFCLSFVRAPRGSSKARRYYLVARTDAEADDWVQTLQVRRRKRKRNKREDQAEGHTYARAQS